MDDIKEVAGPFGKERPGIERSGILEGRPLSRSGKKKVEKVGITLSEEGIGYTIQKIYSNREFSPAFWKKNENKGKGGGGG